MRFNSAIVAIITFLLILFGLGCRKSNVDKISTLNQDTTLAFLSYSVAGDSSADSPENRTIYVQFPATVIAPGAITASFTVPVGDYLTVAGTRQVSGVSVNNFNWPFFYEVHNQLGDSATWEVVPMNNNYTVGWGLGEWLYSSESNDRDYDWYIDQGTTGTCSMSNCGPACVTMAMMWSDSTFKQSTLVARAYANGGCESWNNNFMIGYMATDTVPNAYVPIGDSAEQMRDLFKTQLDSGRIIIIALDMGAIPLPTSPNGRVGQFLPGAEAHYIILKGYKVTELGLYFDVYDPWNLGKAYPDGQPMGQDRFYRYDDIFIGIGNNGGGPQLVVSKKW